MNAHNPKETASLVKEAAIDSVQSSLNLLRKLPPPMMRKQQSIQDIMNEMAKRGIDKQDESEIQHVFFTQDAVKNDLV